MLLFFSSIYSPGYVRTNINAKSDPRLSKLFEVVLLWQQRPPRPRYAFKYFAAWIIIFIPVQHSIRILLKWFCLCFCFSNSVWADRSIFHPSYYYQSLVTHDSVSEEEGGSCCYCLFNDQCTTGTRYSQCCTMASYLCFLSNCIFKIIFF